MMSIVTDSVSDSYAVELGEIKGQINKRDLILQVREHPMLWDRQDSKYKDKRSKIVAWKQICKELVPEWNSMTSHSKTRIVSEINRKWQHIRDAYVKNVKTCLIRPVTKPYIFSNLLKFLNPHIDFDKRSSQIKEEEEDMESENVTEEPWFVSFNENQGNRQPRMLEEGVEVSHDDNIVAVLTNLLQREEDEDKAFFNSILSQVKLLSVQSKIQFRIELLSLLKKFIKNDSNSESYTNVEMLESDNES